MPVIHRSRTAMQTAGLLLLVLIASTATGCAAFGPDSFDPLGSKTKAPLDPNRMVTVEIQPENSPAKQVPLAHEDAMLVQNALEKSGALKRFGRMRVSLVRMRPDGRGPLKMEVKYDSSKRRVSPDTDYALLPGDRVMATEDVSTPVDDALEQILGKMNLFSRS